MPDLPSRVKPAEDLVSADDASLSIKMSEDAQLAQPPDRIRVKNRRKRYLDMNPSYFGPQLELAGRSVT